eukprot:168455-Rhodomonas_salina.2
MVVCSYASSTTCMHTTTRAHASERAGPSTQASRGGDSTTVLPVPALLAELHLAAHACAGRRTRRRSHHPRRYTQGVRSTQPRVRRRGVRLYCSVCVGKAVGLCRGCCSVCVVPTTVCTSLRYYGLKKALFGSGCRANAAGTRGVQSAMNLRAP